uniref:Uncharacterized protein n=1 Tax=Romanomermis culicivorax TaxID=13658 RepID=A0A915KFH3_ROMCU
MWGSRTRHWALVVENRRHSTQLNKKSRSIKSDFTIYIARLESPYWEFAQWGMAHMGIDHKSRSIGNSLIWEFAQLGITHLGIALAQLTIAQLGIARLGIDRTYMDINSIKRPRQVEV